MWQTEQFKNVHLTAVSFSGPLAYSVKRPNNVDAMTLPLADIFCGTDHVIARTTEATGSEVLAQPRPSQENRFPVLTLALSSGVLLGQERLRPVWPW
jgi:hypothetical protein